MILLCPSMTPLRTTTSTVTSTSCHEASSITVKSPAKQKVSRSTAKKVRIEYSSFVIVFTEMHKSERFRDSALRNVTTVPAQCQEAVFFRTLFSKLKYDRGPGSLECDALTLSTEREQYRNMAWLGLLVQFLLSFAISIHSLSINKGHLTAFPECGVSKAVHFAYTHYTS